MLVMGVDERVSKIVALLASPLAIQHPGPVVPPPSVSLLSHPHHVIPLNGLKYRESFPEAPEALELQSENISIDGVGSVPESNHTVQQGLGTYRQTPWFRHHP
jgi:hypothetical protein